MFIHSLTTEPEYQAYDAYVRAHPAGSLWQSLAWKHYQEVLGKEVRIYTNEKRTMKNDKYDVSALVVIDRTAGGYSTWEIPRGPLLNEECKMNNEKLRKFIDEIIALSIKEKVISVYYSPTVFFTLHSSLSISSHRHVHPVATRIIDLSSSEEAILVQMHQKGRYNIKIAEREGVTVRKGSVRDIDTFYALLQETGSRDRFTISQKSHYRHFVESLEDSFILIAEHEKKPIAGLIGVLWNGTGFYYYGASSSRYRNLMAPYALQWEAMRYCKAQGCTSYDLLGVSPDPAPAGDPWIGISDFKRKFGGTIVSSPPEQEIVLKPFVKKILEWKRRIVG